MSDYPREPLEAIQAWLEVSAEKLEKHSSLSADEKKQLVEVEKTIQKLSKLGVTIPDDLRSMKLRLSAKDQACASSDGVDSALVEIEDLIGDLADLLKAAKHLKRKGKSSGVGGPKRHYGISIEELLESGDLSTSDKLELQWAKNGPRIKGKLLEDGRVKVLSGEHTGNYKSLSAAADACAGRSLNGWDHWRRINDDGSETLLTDIRGQYLERGLNNG